MPALTLSPGLVVRLVVVYAVGVAMLVVGVRHTYWAWTGRTDELTTVVEGALAEEPQIRRYLWMIGGPLVTIASLALMGVLTWVLVVQ